MSRRPPGVRRDDGFTMVEVLVSLVVISVVLTAVSAYFVQSMSTVRLQGTRQAAVQIAATSMEQLRALAGTNAVSWLTAQAALAPSNAGTSSSVVYQQQWGWSWSCSTTPTGGCPSDPLTAIAVAPLLAQAWVTVTWAGRGCTTSPGRCTYRLSTQLSLSSSEPVFTS